MKNLTVITRKIDLDPIGTSDEKKTKLNYIKTMAEQLAKIGNEVVRLHLLNQYELADLTNGGTVTKQEALKFYEAKLETSVQNSGYRLLAQIPGIPSDVKTCFNTFIFKTIKANFFDYINCNKSVPSFTKSRVPIYIAAHNNKITGITETITVEDNKYIIRLPLDRDTKKSMDLKFALRLGKDSSNNATILNRILDGTYKLCDSRVHYHADKNKVSIDLVVGMPVKTEIPLIEDKVMGIDIGINRPVSIFILGEKKQPSQIDIGAKIQHDRIKLAKQRSNLQKALKFTSGGHGRKKKLAAMNNLRETEKNWARGINHTISKAVVNLCLENRVGTIQMEDLTGITMDKSDYFLKSWAYYQLQEQIKYKAEAVGIKVLWVNPRNTSITCPVCGTADKENRSYVDKTIFRCNNPNCVAFGLTRDADINAAENISKLTGTVEKPKSKAGRMARGLEKKLVVQEPELSLV